MLSRQYLCFGVGALAAVVVRSARGQGLDLPPAATGNSTTIYVAQGSLAVPLAKRVALQAYGFYLLGDQRGELSLLNVALKLNRYVALAPSYLGLFQPRLADGTPQHEHRARLAATFTLPRRGLYLSDRSLVERRFQVGQASTRYRNLLRVEDSVHLGRLRFTVYAYEEVFYDWRAARWTISQTALGLTYPFGQRYTAEAYYLHQAVRSGPDSTIWALALAVRLGPPAL